MQVTIGKWGNSLAVRLPGEVAAVLGLGDGERVEVELRDGEIAIRRIEPRLALAELFSGKSPDEWRAEYAGTYDWGVDVGREIVPE